MRSFILLIALLTVSTAGWAQTEAGRVMLGGNFSATVTRQEQEVSFQSDSFQSSTTSTDIIVIPQASLFIVDNLAVGLRGGVRFFRAKSESETSTLEINATTISIGPQARYYISLNERLAIYAEGFAALGFGNTATELEIGSPFPFGDPSIPQPDQTTRELVFGVVPGLTYFPIPRVGIDLSLLGVSYQSLNVSEEDADEDLIDRQTTNVGVNLLAPSLGLNVFF